ncbi:hypothetical protein Prudu_010926 [Prunus dulcis]|uniref:Uncharacterized protein n=1 Tax=Prunus dulcis TaxID=3755 RepID=A0A4Y1R9C6_PRUDU|nr:hypothetical protein Prudu_010926 [Prunus dulcis]
MIISSNQNKRSRSSDSIIEKLAAGTGDNKELLEPTTQPSAADNSTNSILQNVGNTVHGQSGSQNAAEAIPQVQDQEENAIEPSIGIPVHD